ncbi:hypothetical protein T4Y61_27855 [Pseudomonas aeruginosa]|uniref:hypothetical protein n=1 Tax=Pseudomonas aeruginosa TaxID=287 RepID=UPI002E1F0846|nr:hypothetical protein [Pseudomonas aeruginosa]
MGAYDSVEKVKSLSFEGSLQRLRASLRLIFSRRWPKEMFVDFLKRVSTFLEEDKRVSEKNILWCWLREDARGIVELKERFFYASLYYLAAVREYDAGREDAAASLAARSALEVGRFDGWQEFMAVVNISYDGRLKGAQAGKIIREALSEKLLELVKGGPVNPESGWSCHEDVVKDFQLKLEGFLDASFNSFSINIDDFIVRSLKNKGELRDVYFGFKRK